ncbi:MAG: thrombospondin type 3 repeat-containing protein [Sandaracinaceae bacterium]
MPCRLALLSSSLLLSAALTGCARDGVIAVSPPAGTECVELLAYPASVACPSAGAPELPSDTPVRALTTCDGAPFTSADFPKTPLTLIAVARDGCAVIGMACAAAQPGEDTLLLIETSLACAPECTEGRCTNPGNACCAAETSDDCDGDGFTNDEEGLADRMDSDGDGTWDACDTDSDNDGLLDVDECRGECIDDCDVVDGEPRVTADTDGDGIEDGLECCGASADGCDPDGDGCPADVDLDSDDDTLPDAREEMLSSAAGCAGMDCDADGICNHLDLDSDGDGAYDVRECPTPSGPECRDAFDPGNLRCGMRRNETCGRCGVTQVCTDFECLPDIRPRYCAPDHRLRLAVGGMPPALGMEDNDALRVRFTPLHHQPDGPGETVRYTVAYSRGFSTVGTLPNPGMESLFERFVASGELACEEATTFEDPACHGVFAMELEDADDDSACSTAEAVVAVSTTSVALPMPNTAPPATPAFFETVFSQPQRAALTRLERGWQIFTPGSGTAWERSTSQLISVAQPMAGCSEPAFPVNDG